MTIRSVEVSTRNELIDALKECPMWAKVVLADTEHHPVTDLKEGDEIELLHADKREHTMSVYSLLFALNNLCSKQVVKYTTPSNKFRIARVVEKKDNRGRIIIKGVSL